MIRLGDRCSSRSSMLRRSPQLDLSVWWVRPTRIRYMPVGFTHPTRKNPSMPEIARHCSARRQSRRPRERSLRFLPTSKQTKNIDFVPAIWRTLATNPVQLEVVWNSLKTLMHPEATGRSRGSIPRPARSSLWLFRPRTAAPIASTRTRRPCANRASTRRPSAKSWPSSGCST